ncbi:NifU-like protein 5, mitochondrial [Holospora obtusa F1]|uniref:NifU-like protein 5, mitochondrial n=1 Tax=Holospora obtusa F1 TaxID=1399147 RepID=W6TU95_HOLOB|nr:NifU family protein [Holospora obtusa]ETZ07317.1 NifU-like protein 5, mitochondrial [Holospora obtusa F1]
MNIQKTPNPLSLKFIISSGVTSGGYTSFFNSQEAQHIPVVKEILDLPGVQHIFLAPDFITITKDQETPWSLLRSIIVCILDHYNASFPLKKLDQCAESVKKEAKYVTDYTEDEKTIIEEIELLIATRIRPNIEEDGGIIHFDHMDMERGIVYVRLDGACSGCPHSKETLTYGIENLLKHYIPEVRSVEEISDDVSLGFFG